MMAMARNICIILFRATFGVHEDVDIVLGLKL
jgi:hypothetical protein